MHKDFGLFFWLHILALIPAYLSPLLVDWWVIIIGVLALQIQHYAIGGCVLTHLEMGKDKNETFIWYYLRKIYPDLSAQRTKIVIRFVVPGVLLVIALILQIELHYKPLIHF
ncbi:MAG: hypothetical protein WCV85_06800 [Patescibacteria group bacterium]|jgi:hypothetical protein